MPYTFDSALDDDLVTVLSRDDDRGRYHVRIGDLQTVVRIRLTRFLTSDDVEFAVSHAIKTPTLMDPYRTSRTIEDDAPYALHRAIEGLTRDFRQAVRIGHIPTEDWLVANSGGEDA